MTSSAVPATPYMGLVPYDEEHAPFFFGREREREIISANLLSSRLTLLYGQSGVGKSSVLRAGVVSHLQRVSREIAAPGEPVEFAVVLFDSWRDAPLQQLVVQVREAVTSAWGAAPSYDGGSLVELLRQSTRAHDREILIILDQFEEYFLYHGADEGDGTLATELPRVVNQRDLRVNILISIRDDALASLDRFKGRIPNLFDNYLRIDHLDRESARRAIEGPIEQYNARLAPSDVPVRIEPEVVEAVLAQVQTGQVVLGDIGRGTVSPALSGEQESRIETPYLQLVVTRLWTQDVGSGSHVLQLRTLNELGGAERIVRTHLDAAMARLPAADQDVAARIFRFLVTPSGAKIAHTARDLAEYGDIAEERVMPVVDRLTGGDVRILRPVAPPADHGGPMRYQIFHDVLAPAVLDWRARFTRERELAEARRQSVQNRVVQMLHGRIWTAVKQAAIGGLLITGLMLEALYRDPDAPGSALPLWLTVGGIFVGLMVLVIGQGETWFSIWQGTRRARALGLEWVTVAELLSDPNEDTPQLISGSGRYSALDDKTRRRLRRTRLVTAGATWLACAGLPWALIVALVLAGRGVLGTDGVAALALVPSATVLLIAFASLVWQTILLPAPLRHRRDGHHDDVTGIPAARFLLAPQSRDATTTDRGRADRSWRLALVLAMTWLAVSIITVVAAVIITVPLIGGLAFQLGLGNGLAVDRVRQTNIDINRQYRLPTESSISALDAGRALYAMSEAGAANGRPVFGPSVPRALPQWIADTDMNTNPFREQWSALIGGIVARALKGFSPDETRFLERITSHPGFAEYALVARAADIDWMGARVGVPFPKGVSVVNLPVPSFLAFRRASEVQIARAAFLLAQGRAADAEMALREVVSVGVALRESSNFLLGALIGDVVARMGLDNLETVLTAANRTSEAGALRDARLAATAANEAAANQRRNESDMPFDMVRARRRVVADLNARSQVRGLRWEALIAASLAPCSNARELVFGPAESLRAAAVSARSDLVRSPSDAAFYELVQTTFISPDDVALGVVPKLLYGIGNVADKLLGTRRIPACILAPIVSWSVP